jgi:hypothetical protein
MGFGEFHNEVDTDGVPVNIRDWQWVEFAKGWLSVYLRSQAQVTCLGIFANVSQHVGPPIISRNEIEGLPSPRVPCNT